ncbi:MAG: hypothetical protein L0323_14285 [Planctomycetes bacterium]|nr:hypothetical protein [Planctomycetota bacterium]
MILRSIRVEGWRGFAAPVQVGPFAEGLNVLHAPNATGKSTLFEALMRGLLDGHGVGGRDVESLRPWGRTLSPTVTIEFAAEGVEYRIEKRFLEGAFSRLARKEGERFVPYAEGDAADEKVRVLLSRNPPGRGLARPENSGLAQVLWAPQGLLALEGLSGDVLSDIRTILGAEVAGAGAEGVEARIEEAYLRFFTPGGKLRSGKEAAPLLRLQEELQESSRRRREGVEKMQEYEATVRKVEDLRATRAQARRDMDEVEGAVSAARAHLEEHRRLVSEGSRRAEQVKGAEARHSGVKRLIEDLAAARRSLSEARRNLDSVERELPAQEREVTSRQADAARRRTLLDAIRKEEETLENARREAGDARSLLDAKELVTQLSDRLKKIRSANELLTKRKEQRAGIVAPDERGMRAIRKAAGEKRSAQDRLDAALITLEIEPRKKLSMRIETGEQKGARKLEPGKRAEAKGSPEVVVELRDIARIRARGPAESADRIREERDRAAEQLRRLTRGFGTEELDALETLFEKASGLDRKVAEAEAQLEGLLGGEAPETLDEELRRKEGVVGEILKERTAWKERSPDAEKLAKAAEKERRSWKERLAEVEKGWEAGSKAQAAAEQVRVRLEERRDNLRREQGSLTARIADLETDGKTDAERGSALAEAAREWDAAKAALSEIQEKLRVLGADPAETVRKLERRRQESEGASRRTLEAEKIAEGKLEVLAAQGPYSELARAEEEVARLEGEISREDLRVGAVRLLRETIASCRRDALASVAKPVEDRATRILHRIGGPRLGRVRLGAEFEPGHVVPETAGEEVAIAEVSGGEKEQIYLATRLALAEVLARGDRQLVVLDDVLTATDTGRLARILSVLEESARELQILILTCHPERYRGLDGTRFTDLEGILAGGAGSPVS